MDSNNPTLPLNNELNENDTSHLEHEIENVTSFDLNDLQEPKLDANDDIRTGEVENAQADGLQFEATGDNNAEDASGQDNGNLDPIPGGADKTEDQTWGGADFGADDKWGNYEIPDQNGTEHNEMWGDYQDNIQPIAEQNDEGWGAEQKEAQPVIGQDNATWGDYQEKSHITAEQPQGWGDYEEKNQPAIGEQEEWTSYQEKNQSTYQHEDWGNYQENDQPTNNHQEGWGDYDNKIQNDYNDQKNNQWGSYMQNQEQDSNITKNEWGDYGDSSKNPIETNIYNPQWGDFNNQQDNQINDQNNIPKPEDIKNIQYENKNEGYPSYPKYDEDQNNEKNVEYNNGDSIYQPQPPESASNYYSQPRSHSRYQGRNDRSHQRKGNHGGNESSETNAAKIFVGGLSWSTTEEEIGSHFSAYGEVANVVLMRESGGRSRGFGFVIFTTPTVLEVVLSQDHVIGDKKVDVKKALGKTNHSSRESRQSSRAPRHHGNDKPPLKIFVGGLPSEVTEEDLTQAFSQFGMVTAVNLMIDKNTGRSRGFGFVEFNDPAAVNSSLSSSGLLINGKAIDIKPAQYKQGSSSKGSHNESRGTGGPTRHRPSYTNNYNPKYNSPYTNPSQQGNYRAYGGHGGSGSKYGLNSRPDNYNNSNYGYNQASYNGGYGNYGVQPNGATSSYGRYTSQRPPANAYTPQAVPPNPAYDGYIQGYQAPSQHLPVANQYGMDANYSMPSAQGSGYSSRSNRYNPRPQGYQPPQAGYHGGHDGANNFYNQNPYSR